MTPDDIAEVVVFTAGRRENVVIADTLIFPSHQVSHIYSHDPDEVIILTMVRLPQDKCTGSLHNARLRKEKTETEVNR